MSLSPGQRRLAAIMYTDMVGYTALGQKNESLSLALVEAQRELVRPILNRHNGREVKTMGDAFLVEFASALDAVRCAYDIQRTTREFNISRPSEEKIHLRVGVHLGDVSESDDDISGDAVNVASRIQPLAEDGGVCLTRQVYDQVHNKFELPLTSLGVKPLKNVIEAMEVFKMVMPWDREMGSPWAQMDTKRIAILPFANMSPDPNDSYFADGITEEVISTLSRVSGLNVISRTSVMGYKGSTKRIREIGGELEVGSILEGSFRKAGNRIRITIQLIDVGSDMHVWAQNYDRELNDVFAIQSEIAEKVSEMLKVKLLSEEVEQLETPPTTSTEAYTLFLKGKQRLNEGTDKSLREALELFNSATKLDPSYARAYVAIGGCYFLLGLRSYITFDESLSGMKSAAKKALEIDGDLAEGHYLRSQIAWVEDDHVMDEIEAHRAIELNPNLAQAHAMLGIVKASNGYPKESIRLLETAHSLDPLESEILRILGRMYIYTGRMNEALELCSKNLRFAPFTASLLMVEYYLVKRDYSRAEEEMRSLESHYPEDIYVIVFRGYLSALKGDRDEAERIVDRLEKNFGGSATLERNIGYVRYHLGDMDTFYAAMGRAAEDHVLDPAILRYSPLFEKARQDPRYREVMLKSNLDPDLKE